MLIFNWFLDLVCIALSYSAVGYIVCNDYTSFVFTYCTDPVTVCERNFVVALIVSLLTYSVLSVSCLSVDETENGLLCRVEYGQN